MGLGIYERFVDRVYHPRFDFDGESHSQVVRLINLLPKGETMSEDMMDAIAGIMELVFEQYETVEAVQERLSNEESRHGALVEELRGALMEEIAGLKKDINGVRTQQLVYREQLAKAVTERDALEVSLDHARREMEKMRERLLAEESRHKERLKRESQDRKEARAKYDKLKLCCAEQDMEIARVNEQYRKMAREFDVMKKTAGMGLEVLDERDEEVARLQKKVKERDVVIEGLEGSLDECYDEITSLKGTLVWVKGEREREVALLKAKIEEMRVATERIYGIPDRRKAPLFDLGC